MKNPNLDISGLNDESESVKDKAHEKDADENA